MIRQVFTAWQLVAAGILPLIIGTTDAGATDGVIYGTATVGGGRPTGPTPGSRASAGTSGEGHYPPAPRPRP
jgi:hypothetical protein